MFSLNNHQENSGPLIILVKIWYFGTGKMARQIQIFEFQNPHKNLGLEIQIYNPSAEEVQTGWSRSFMES